MEVDLRTIFTLLDRYEARFIARGVHDNQRCIGLWLKLFGDGSGSVMAEYHDVKPGYEEESKATVRMVMTMNPTSVIDFDSIEELHGALVAATCETPREHKDGAD